jgi:hypothetical protein
VTVARDDSAFRQADLSFEGLKQTIFEPGERVFIGAEPEIEVRVRKNETRYIQALHVTCKAGYANSSGTWFKDVLRESGGDAKEIAGTLNCRFLGYSALAAV